MKALHGVEILGAALAAVFVRGQVILPSGAGGTLVKPVREARLTSSLPERVPTPSPGNGLP